MNEGRGEDDPQITEEEAKTLLTQISLSQVGDEYENIVNTETPNYEQGVSFLADLGKKNGSTIVDEQGRTQTLFNEVDKDLFENSAVNSQYVLDNATTYNNALTNTNFERSNDVLNNTVRVLSNIATDQDVSTLSQNEQAQLVEDFAAVREALAVEMGQLDAQELALANADTLNVEALDQINEDRTKLEQIQNTLQGQQLILLSNADKLEGIHPELVQALVDGAAGLDASGISPTQARNFIRRLQAMNEGNAVGVEDIIPGLRSVLNPKNDIAKRANDGVDTPPTQTVDNNGQVGQNADTERNLFSNRSPVDDSQVDDLAKDVVPDKRIDLSDGTENNLPPTNTTGQYLDDFEPSPTPTQLVKDANGQTYTANIRYDHVLDGNINGIGNGSGGHYIRSDNVRVVEVIDPPDANGVIRANTQIRDPQTGGWVDKPQATTFYPEHWTRRQTVQEIEGAFQNSKPIPGALGQPPRMWEGTSPSGVKIQGFYTRPEGGAATAWPVHQGAQ